jgi:hypothetical protein
VSRIEFEGDAPDPDHVQRVIMDEAEQGMRQACLALEGQWRALATPARRTGTYMRSITTEVTRVSATRIHGTVGTNLFYAPYLEYGTGLYGPNRQLIYPKRASVLRFPQPGNPGFTLAGRRRSGRAGAAAAYVYARYVRGIRPRRYAERAADLARATAMAAFRAAGARAAARLRAS